MIIVYDDDGISKLGIETTTSFIQKHFDNVVLLTGGLYVVFEIHPSIGSFFHPNALTNKIQPLMFGYDDTGLNYFAWKYPEWVEGEIPEKPEDLPRIVYLKNGKKVWYTLIVMGMGWC